LDAEVGAAFHEAIQEVTGPVRPSFVDDFIEGLNPFGGLLGIEVIGSVCFYFEHGG
jgi:hypothetical protein